MRRRLDQELVRRGLASSQTEARELVLAGHARVNGSPATKPGTLVAPSEAVAVEGPAGPYVSRGGEKLVAALDGFEIETAGARCLDAGASTGGFTHALLERGAAHVVAVDVGYGQLAWSLRTDERVTVMDRQNVRALRVADLPYAPDLVVADLSFISLASVVPTLAGLAAPEATFVLLVKPQFETGREDIGPGGVVSDPEVWRRAIQRVERVSREAGVGPLAVMPSPVRGPAGNVEFLLHARKGSEGRELELDRALDEVPA